MTTPFQVQGNSVSFTAAATPPTAQLVKASDQGQAPQVVLTNTGDEVVLVAWGPTSTAAVDKATAGNFVYVLLPNTQVSISAPTNQYYTGKALANTSIVYVTPGYGV